MKRLMISAMASGSGKTVLTCGLLAALTARGHAAQALKCGPDYIDPMFHEKVLGVPSRNLDLFLQGEDGVRRTLLKQKGDYVVVEGAMGFYDGVNGTDRASAWQVARTASLPVVLAIRPGGSSLTLAAQVKGLLTFRADSQIRGLVLTACRPSLYAHLAPILEEETGLPVLGYLHWQPSSWPADARGDRRPESAVPQSGGAVGKDSESGRLMGVGGGNRENSRSRPPKTVPTKELLCHRRGVGCGLLFLLCG